MYRRVKNIYRLWTIETEWVLGDSLVGHTCYIYSLRHTTRDTYNLSLICKNAFSHSNRLPQIPQPSNLLINFWRQSESKASWKSTYTVSVVCLLCRAADQSCTDSNKLEQVECLRRNSISSLAGINSDATVPAGYAMTTIVDRWYYSGGK